LADEIRIIQINYRYYLKNLGIMPTPIEFKLIFFGLYFIYRG